MGHHMSQTSNLISHFPALRPCLWSGLDSCIRTACPLGCPPPPAHIPRTHSPTPAHYSPPTRLSARITFIWQPREIFELCSMEHFMTFPLPSVFLQVCLCFCLMRRRWRQGVVPGFVRAAVWILWRSGLQIDQPLAWGAAIYY